MLLLKYRKHFRQKLNVFLSLELLVNNTHATIEHTPDLLCWCACVCVSYAQILALIGGKLRSCLRNVLSRGIVHCDTPR